DHPTGQLHSSTLFTPPDAMVRNRWTPSTGMGGGRHVPESAVVINRGAHPPARRGPTKREAAPFYDQSGPVTGECLGAAKMKLSSWREAAGRYPRVMRARLLPQGEHHIVSIITRSTASRRSGFSYAVQLTRRRSAWR